MGDLCCTVGNTDILGNNCIMYMVVLCITARKRTPELGCPSLVVHLPSHTMKVLYLALQSMKHKLHSVALWC